MMHGDTSGGRRAQVGIDRFWKTSLVLALQMAAAITAAEEQREQASDSAAPRTLFNGQNLEGWRVAEDGFFDRHGEVRVENGVIQMAAGQPGTGVVWTGEMPRSNYEVQLEAMRSGGSDFFCGLTFPVGESYCTFIAGGWGGGVTGLSNIDDLAAVENETTDFINFQPNHWYRIRLRVTDERIRAWIDDKKMVDVQRAERKFSIWSEQEPMRPLGIATWVTSARVRKIQLEHLK